MSRNTFVHNINKFRIVPNAIPPQVQTHTWFSPTYKITKLFVSEEDTDEFQELVFDYISKSPGTILEDPARGENCITEKINKNKFKLFADIDFDVSVFEKFEFPTDERLKDYMADVVKVFDETVSEIYGEEHVQDKIVGGRLPYKIHITYPTVVVDNEIANHVANTVIEKLKKDNRFKEALAAQEKIVDKSVYNTGLRMLGMHKGIMGGKDKTKLDIGLRSHENLFGENTYVHCYKIVDPETFEPLPWNLNDFKRACVRSLEHEEITKDKEGRPAKSHVKGKGRSKAIRKNDSSSTSKEVIKKNFILDDSSDEDEEFVTNTAGEIRNPSVTLAKTLKFIKSRFHHIFDEEKIKISSFMHDENGTQEHHKIIIPLDTTECPLADRKHKNNRQYIRIDKDGIRQKCHKCPGDIGKITVGKLNSAVRGELEYCKIIKPKVGVVAKKRKPVSDEKRMEAVKDVVKRVAPYFVKNELAFDEQNVIFNDMGIHIGLNDLWCEVCQRVHDAAYTYLQATENGKLCLMCKNSPQIGKYFPEPPINVDMNIRQYLFANCNVNFSQTIVNNNYSESTGDVPVEFEQEPIFENDDVLNHLMFESLSNTSWSVMKVIHHLGKEMFNCTKDGQWYTYRRHRWHPDSEGAFAYFISENVVQYYRQTRDYYRENTENPDLRQKRVAHIQRIIDKLTNCNQKGELLKDAKVVFYEEDFYMKGEKHFEEQLDQHRHLLCFSNGIYDLDNDLFRDGSPQDFLTLSVLYDYPEKSDPKHRATVIKFFTDMQPDEEEREYLLLFLSSMLSGYTKEEVFHIFTGTAANGKSLLRDLLMHTLGEYFESIPANLLTKERPSSSSPQPEIVKLKGKRCVFGSEPEIGQKINTGFMKWLTGNDPMKARLCHSNTLVEFQPQFKISLLANDLPAMDNSDFGTGRRTRIVSFPVTFMENPRPNEKYEKLIDESFKNRIAECKEEFVLYLLEYYRKFKLLPRLKPTANVNRVTNLYKKASNTVAQFLDEMTEVCEHSAVLIKDLYVAYAKFIRETMPGEIPLKKSNLIDEIKRMRDINFSESCRIKGRSGGGQLGIKFRRLVDRNNDKEENEEDHQDALEDGSNIVPAN